MNSSLRTTLVLSYLSIAIITAGLIFLLTQFSVTRRLARELVAEDLREIHDEVLHWVNTEPDWDGFPQYFQTLHPAEGSEFVRGGRSGQRVTTLQHGVIDGQRRALVPFAQYEIGDQLPEALLIDALPVIIDQATIAWIVPDVSSLENFEVRQTLYVQNTNFVLMMSSVAAVLIALLVGFLFSKRILKPISALTQASEAMASGNLEQTVAVVRQDELGTLASSFNSMSEQVALSNQRRRDLTAAIAHDLSTPLHIVAGYIEIIQDNAASATPETFEVITAELDQLQRLVEDLDTLSLTDTNQLSLNLEPLRLHTYLPQMVKTFQVLAEPAGVTLQYEGSQTALPLVLVDSDRLTQVFRNLIANSVRYTPTGGVIRIGLHQAGDCLVTYVADTGIGIAPEELPFIFNRFYQADKSRTQNGKMGLGLSIAQGLIESMGGSISAASDGVNQGATITISLPIA